MDRNTSSKDLRAVVGTLGSCEGSTGAGSGGAGAGVAARHAPQPGGATPRRRVSQTGRPHAELLPPPPLVRDPRDPRGRRDGHGRSGHPGGGGSGVGCRDHGRTRSPDHRRPRGRRCPTDQLGEDRIHPDLAGVVVPWPAYREAVSRLRATEAALDDARARIVAAEAELASLRTAGTTLVAEIDLAAKRRAEVEFSPRGAPRRGGRSRGRDLRPGRRGHGGRCRARPVGLDRRHGEPR